MSTWEQGVEERHRQWQKEHFWSDMIPTATVLLMVFLFNLFSGCVNCIVRHSTNPPHIESIYQSTRMAAAGTIVLACPQMMSDAPSDHGFSAENLFTIPLGILEFCVDVPCEFVLDTLCLPYDAYKTFNKTEAVK